MAASSEVSSCVVTVPSKSEPSATASAPMTSMVLTTALAMPAGVVSQIAPLK